MLYLFLDRNQVKLLYLKKSILGQFETRVFSKNYTSDLLQDGKILNVDYIASAIKEALQSLSTGGVKEKNTTLILAHESYSFLKIEVPTDVTQAAIDSFVKDKARSNLPKNLDEYAYDFFVEQGSNEKNIYFFAIHSEFLSSLKEALHLIDLKIDVVLPETAAYFNLFQKTLRKDKKENILYINYEKNQLTGFLYDSLGQASSEKWIAKLTGEKKVEDLLKEKAAELEKSGKKINRIILAGPESETIRQDTFTKAVGVWTNPLKRITPEFYQDYLKLLANSPDKPFSVLTYEACLGGFIFNQEHKNFSLQNNLKGGKSKFISLPALALPLKEVLIFLFSFIISFGLFFALSRYKLPFTLSLNLPFLQKTTIQPTIVPTKTPPKPKVSPTPSINKVEIKIKVLNGSGTVGKASEVRDLLKEKGYSEILTGNADSFEYETTEIQVKESKTDAVILLKNDLKDNVTSPTEATLDEDEAADVVIIIGQDFE